MATTNSTESRESNPNSANVACLVNFLWSHLAADLSTCMTLASTYSNKATWVGSDVEVNKYRIYDNLGRLDIVGLTKWVLLARQRNIVRSIVYDFI